MNCNEAKMLMYKYLDKELNEMETVSFLDHIDICDECACELFELRSLEGHWQEACSLIEPPTDFKANVMSAISEQKDKVVLTPVKTLAPKRQMGRIAMFAAAAAIFAIGLSSYDFELDTPETDIPTPEVIEPFVEEPVVEPDDDIIVDDVVVDETDVPETNDPVVEEPVVTEPVVEEPVAEEPKTPTPAIDVTDITTEEDLEEQMGSVDLPQPNYGTEVAGAFTSVLLAGFEDIDIYSPNISNSGSSVSFYTNTNDALQVWSVNTDANSEAKVLGESEDSDISEIEASCTIYELDTGIFSPDGTMFAVNARSGEVGLWVALASGDIELMATEGGGDLLAWSPNSTKIAFTGADDCLYVYYVMEAITFKLTDTAVLDLTWSDDSSSIAYVVDGELWTLSVY